MVPRGNTYSSLRSLRDATPTMLDRWWQVPAFRQIPVCVENLYPEKIWTHQWTVLTATAREPINSKGSCPLQTHSFMLCKWKTTLVSWHIVDLHVVVCEPIFFIEVVRWQQRVHAIGLICRTSYFDQTKCGQSNCTSTRHFVLRGTCSTTLWPPKDSRYWLA